MNTDKIKPRTVFSTIGIALSLFLITGQGLTIVMRLVMVNAPAIKAFFQEQQIIYLMVNYAFIYGLGFLVFWLITKRLDRLQPADKTFSFKELFQFFCIGYAFAISSNYIGILISLIFGNQTNIAVNISDMIGTGRIFTWVLMIIVAPVVEEMIFRKMIIDRTFKYGEKYAIIFSAVCFGLFHLNLQQFLYAASIGMVLGYVYSKSGKIHYTIIMHSLINAIGYLVTMIAQPLLEGMRNISISSIMNGGSISDSLNPASLIILYIAEQAVLVIVALGIVFFIRKVKKIRFDYSSPDCLERKAVFRTICLNAGVIIFILICIAGMVVSFMGGVEKLIPGM